ncbi:MAG: hypothetical protein LW852_10060, partial [Sediminibacterium sp.]|nr:hypothetical protein [Sediminibacterium sp.]
EFMQQYDWTKVAECCHELALEYANAFHACLGTNPISPLNKEWIGQMVRVPIHTNEPAKLQRLLLQEYKIEVPLMRQGTDVYLRYSIQAFNTRKNLDYLLETLKKLKEKGELIL